MEKLIKVWTNGNGITKYKGQDKRTYQSNHRADDGYKIMIAKLYEVDANDTNVVTKIDVPDMNNGISCGNCKSFKSEYIEWYGNCKEFEKGTNTNEYCERWEEK